MLYLAQIHQLADKFIKKSIHSDLMRPDIFLFFLFLFQQLRWLKALTATPTRWPRSRPQQQTRPPCPSPWSCSSASPSRLRQRCTARPPLLLPPPSRPAHSQLRLGILLLFYNPQKCLFLTAHRLQPVTKTSCSTASLRHSPSCRDCQWLLGLLLPQPPVPLSPCQL